MITSARPGSFLTQITDWTNGVTYALYQYVYYSGKMYRCTTAHTSSAAFSSDVANWLELNVNSYSPLDVSSVIALG